MPHENTRIYMDTNMCETVYTYTNIHIQVQICIRFVSAPLVYEDCAEGQADRDLNHYLFSHAESTSADSGPMQLHVLGVLCFLGVNI